MTSAADHDRVRALLGREPQGGYEIVVRDAGGDPVVLRNAPLLDDATPMPTRYWLVAPDEIRRVGRLESAGGVARAEAAIAPADLADAHARYAAERDAAIPSGHTGPRPSGGVGGTRTGVKCLHAHWAWHLAGGDDPVGRWIERELAAAEAPATGATHDAIVVGGDSFEVRLRTGDRAVVPWGSASLTDRWLRDDDPPRPDALTNALGIVDDHLDDVVRTFEAFERPVDLHFDGSPIHALAALEVGFAPAPVPHDVTRAAIEEVFRIVATEPVRDRALQPGLDPSTADTVVATCCIVLAAMRRFHLDRAVLGAA